MKTLVYPGAGWDDSFLHLPLKKSYEKYILMDSLPVKPHYEPGQPGWLFTQSPKRFFNTLIEVFGQGGNFTHDEKACVFTFDVTSVEYHYNMNVNILAPGKDPLPVNNADYDVYISGYFPKWNKKFFGKSSKVYVFNVWDFGAVAKEKYTAKKNLVDFTDYTQDGDDELEEMDRIMRNVMKKEKIDATANDD